MAVPYSPSSALQPVIGAALPPYPVAHWGVVVREFTREQHREHDEAYLDTVHYLYLGMWVRPDPERAPQGVDAAGWAWARISCPMLDELGSGWVHPEICLPVIQ